MCLVHSYIKRAIWAFFLRKRYPPITKRVEIVVERAAQLVAQIVNNLDHLDVSGLGHGATSAGLFAYYVQNMYKRHSKLHASLLKKLVGMRREDPFNLFLDKMILIIFFLHIFESHIVINPLEIPFPKKKNRIGPDAAEHVQVIFTTGERHADGHTNINVKIINPKNLAFFIADIFTTTAAKRMGLVAAIMGPPAGGTADYRRADPPVLLPKQVVVGVHTTFVEGENFDLTMTEAIIRAIRIYT